MIIKRLVAGAFESNCYIVGSEATKEGLIIDAGADARQIMREVKKSGLTIKLIVITHAHIDHIGVLKEIKQSTGAPVAIHSADAPRLQHPREEKPLGFPFQVPPPADRLLAGGDSIDVGDIHLLVLHTPGHSPGSICLLGSGVVFTGDTLFNYGIGRSDFPGGSYSQLLTSIHTKLMILPDATVAYPGHGPETTIGAERRGNPFLR